MTFPIKDGMQTYKPKFELPSDGQAAQPLADQQTAAGIIAKLPILHEVLILECESWRIWLLLTVPVNKTGMQVCSDNV